MAKKCIKYKREPMSVFRSSSWKVNRNIHESRELRHGEQEIDNDNSLHRKTSTTFIRKSPKPHLSKRQEDDKEGEGQTHENEIEVSKWVGYSLFTHRRQRIWD